MTTTKNEELEKRISKAERNVYRAEDKFRVASIRARRVAKALANQLKDINLGIDRDAGIKRVDRIRTELTGYLTEFCYWEEKRLICLEILRDLRRSQFAQPCDERTVQAPEAGASCEQ